MNAEDIAANVLSKFATRDGTVLAYAPGNLVILTDTGENIRRMQRILEVDVATPGDKVWLEPLDHVSAALMVAKLINDIQCLNRFKSIALAELLNEEDGLLNEEGASLKEERAFFGGERGVLNGKARPLIAQGEVLNGKAKALIAQGEVLNGKAKALIAQGGALIGEAKALIGEGGRGRNRRERVSAPRHEGVRNPGERACPDFRVTSLEPHAGSRPSK